MPVGRNAQPNRRGYSTRDLFSDVETGVRGATCPTSENPRDARRSSRKAVQMRRKGTEEGYSGAKAGRNEGEKVACAKSSALFRTFALSYLHTFALSFAFLFRSACSASQLSLNFLHERIGRAAFSRRLVQSCYNFLRHVTPGIV